MTCSLHTTYYVPIIFLKMSKIQIFCHGRIYEIFDDSCVNQINVITSLMAWDVIFLTR